MNRREVRRMHRMLLQSFLLGAIIVCLAASVLAYAVNLPTGVLPTPGESQISLSLDSDTYAPGDKIQITIEAKNAGFLYLYDIDPAGAITLLYPNRYEPDPSINQGTMRLPGEGYHFVVGGPEGIETVVAILAQAPIDQLSPSSKAPFRPLDIKPQALVTELSTALSSTAWTSTWVQFNVYQPKGIVHVESQPTGAKIRVNGHDRGIAPKDLILPAGKAEITLSKIGYQPFNETVVVYDQDIINIDARLQEAMPYPGSYGVSLPVYVGIDAGTDSIGMEVGIARAVGIAAALRFTEDTTLVPGETYNFGPELDIDLRLHLQVTERLAVVLGGGIGLQNRTRAPAVPEGTFTQAITIEPDIETDVLPSFVLGMEFNLEHASVFSGYHLRRGFIFGVGLQF